MPNPAAQDHLHAQVCFSRLAATAAHDERCYDLGGGRFSIRYLDERLFPLVHRALAHLERPADGGRDLTLHLCTSAGPPLAMSHERWLDASRMWKRSCVRSDALFAHFVPGDDGRLVLLHGDQQQACVAYRNPERVPAWDTAAPLREVIHAWHRLRDGHVVHGAAIADEAGAVLLAGVGGSGKSNTALTCLLHSNLSYLGDDLCLVRRRMNQLFVHSLYNSAKLLSHDQARYADMNLARLDDSARGDGKPTFFLDPPLRHRLAAARPLRAILLPCVRPQSQTRLVPASPADAWRAIAPSTVSLIPSDDEGWRWLGLLVKEVPLWRLELGERREQIPEVIRQFLAAGVRGAAA